MSRWALVAAVMVGACGGADDERVRHESATANTQVEQEALQCPSRPTVLVGKALEGERCVRAEDCAPTCCRCGPVPFTDSWLAAACIDGRCLGGVGVCDRTDEDRAVCPRRQ